MRNPYDVLGVSKTADTKEIKKAYKQLARKYHPDINDTPGAAEKFKEINGAWDVLGDKKKRKMYDTYGTASFKEGARGPGGNPFDFSGFRGAGAGHGGPNMDDILGSMFGGGGRGTPRVGRDIHVTMEVSPMISFTGGTKQLRIKRSSGIQDTVQVKIQAGVSDGEVLCLKGQGHPPNGGGPCGNLNLRLKIGEHHILRRSGKNLEMELPLTIGESLRGKSLQIPSVTGEIKVTIPPNSNNGTKLRIKGKGVQTVPAGDLVLILRPQLPTGRTEMLEPAIEMFEQEYCVDVRVKLHL